MYGMTRTEHDATLTMSGLSMYGMTRAEHDATLPTKKIVPPLFRQKTKIQGEVQHRGDTGSREHEDKLIASTSASLSNEL